MSDQHPLHLFLQQQRRQPSALLLTSSVGLGVVGLLSAPALVRLAARLRPASRNNAEPAGKVYEDNDGKSTPEAVKVFGAKIPKAVALFSALAGLGLSVTLAALTTISEDRDTADSLFLENWLCAASWGLLTFQAICIVASRKSVVAYELGIYSMLSCIVLAAVLLVQDTRLLSQLLHRSKIAVGLRLGELGAAVILALSSLTIPRRPDVFFDNQLVDRMYTNSAWSRFNWSWPSNVLRKAVKQNNLDLVDLPRPDQYRRAHETTVDWESRNFKGPLWLSIVSAHKWMFALQWAITLLSAVLNFAPQWCVLQLLRILENRRDNSPLGYQAWIWVVWIAVSIFAQSWVESYSFWMSWADLAIPIRAQLSALIFQKSMRRKDVKEASKKKPEAEPLAEVGGDAAAAMQAATTANAPDAPEMDNTDEEAEKVKRSKQSTVNLIGVDAKRVSDFAMYNNYFPGSFFKLLVSLAFLVELLGWKALVAGFATMLATTPLNIFFARRYANAQDNLMKMRDIKMGVVSEALQGIRQIKFSALEPQWEQKINEVREKELAVLWTCFRNDVMLFLCWITNPILLAAVSLAAYAGIYGSLIPSVAFVSLGVFKALEVTLSVVPELTTDALDAWVSMKRIGDYLQGPEITKITKDSDEVSFDAADIAWPSENTDEDPDRFVLRDVNVTFPKGELSVISGQTGAGKSLMLAAILGEVDILKGTLSVPRAPSDRRDDKAHAGNWIIPGAIAFVAQIPWIENATVRENILFGLPYEEARYKETVRACALSKDMEMFSDGEFTEIGANGINLSGGQKWRITLARAIYSRSGILVLDDIFSAVDAHVGRHIYEECLTGALGQGRTRILVTHHVGLCEPRTKFLMELGGGGVLHAGLLSELEEDGTLEQIKSHQEPEAEFRPEEDDNTTVNSEEGEGRSPATTASSNTETTDGEALIGEPMTKTPSKQPDARKFVEEEKREKGSIKKHVYAVYLRDSGGWIFWTGCVTLFLFVQVLTVGRSWWLRVWTGSYEGQDEQQLDRFASLSNSTLPTPVFSYAQQFQLQGIPASLHAKMMQPMVQSEQNDLAFYLGIYVLLAVLTCIFSTSRWYYVFCGSIQASRSLFARLNFVVLRAPLRWLDTVPLGRVLNRFTADFNSLDSHLAYAVAFASGAFLNLVGVIVAGLFVSGYILLLAAVLLSIAVWYASQYLKAARPVKRLESNTKSPVFEQFSSSLTGVTTIRSFDKAPVYVSRMHRKLDDWTVATWHLWLFNRWMGWRMSVVGSFFASLVAILILLTPDMDAALAGFALAFALDFSGSVMWTIRHYANVELEMNAAERIVEYSELPTESLEGTHPPAAWPTEGRIEVDELVVSYADDLDPVLKGLTFSIDQGQRVGVVGRTGAGKSSLTLALFRFLEARSGSVHIDGIDISKLKLHDLRSRLAIIPQDPVLFSGTVRSNLDPFDNHTDAELFDSLARVHLINEDQIPTASAPGTGTATPVTPTTRSNTNPFTSLSSSISEGGLNLSQGQRQLLCLARAIVSRPKVMVLDEATSAVDMATDTRIQRSIREDFSGSTLLVIAHRLSTIADFDRILVLSDGRVEEFGSPADLWGKEGEGISKEEWGAFRAMCEESGERDRLRDICLATKK